jgi:hypothetical protein
MRKFLISLGLAASMTVAFAGGVSAHVHGITPLSCVGVADDGANKTDDLNNTADDIINGLIPTTVGEADNENRVLDFGDGGSDTPPNDCE